MRQEKRGGGIAVLNMVREVLIKKVTSEQIPEGTEGISLPGKAFRYRKEQGQKHRGETVPCAQGAASQPVGPEKC